MSASRRTHRLLHGDGAVLLRYAVPKEARLPGDYFLSYIIVELLFQCGKIDVFKIRFRVFVHRFLYGNDKTRALYINRVNTQMQGGDAASHRPSS